MTRLTGDILFIFPSDEGVREYIGGIIATGRSNFVPSENFVTFDRIADFLGQHIPDRGTPVGRFVEDFILARVLEEFYARGQGGYFRPFHRKKGFRNSLRELFAFFANNFASPETVTVAMELLGEQSPVFRDRYAEMARLYTLFLEEVERRRILPASYFRYQLHRFLTEGARDDLFPGIAEVRVAGLPRLTEIEIEIVRAFLRWGKRVEVRFPFARSTSGRFGLLSGILDRLQSLAVAFPGQVELLFHSDSRTPVLDYLSTSLFAAGDDLPEPPADAGGGPPLALLEGVGRINEIELVARRAARLIHDHGYRPGEVCVAVRRLEPYRRAIREVFRRTGLPFVIESGQPLTDLPVIRLLLSVYAIPESDFALDAVLKVVNSGLFDLSRFGEYQSLEIDPATIEPLAYRAGIIEGDPMHWSGRFEALARKQSRDGQPPSVEERETAARVCGFIKAVDQLWKRMPYREHIARCRAFLASCNLFSALNRSPSFAIEDIRAVQAFSDMLEGMGDHLEMAGAADAAVDPGTFVTMLEEIAGSERVESDEEGDRVRVVDVENLPGRVFRAVFVAGLVDGDFPLRITQNPFFRADQQQLFNELIERKVFMTAAEKFELEQILFHTAAGAARERLCLSRPYRDMGGRPFVPSAFVERVQELLPADSACLTVERTDPLRGPPALHECVTLRELLSAVCLGPAERRVLPEPLPALHDSPEVVRIKAKMAAEQERDLFNAGSGPATRFSGAVDRPEAHAHLASVILGSETFESWSASKLEAYSTCPFMFLTAYVLNLYSLRRPRREIEPSEAGSLVHEILCTYHKRLEDLGLDPHNHAYKKRLQEEMRHVFGEVVGRYERESFSGLEELWPITRREMEESLLRFIDSETSERQKKYLPRFHEFQFGQTGHEGDEAPDMEALLIGSLLDSSPIRVVGKIDRIDMDRDGRHLRIVDYKYSRSSIYDEKLKFEEIIQGKNFQIPLYFQAARRHFTAMTGRDYKGEGTYYLLRESVDAMLPEYAFDERSFGRYNRQLRSEKGVLLNLNWDDYFETGLHKRLELEEERKKIADLFGVEVVNNLYNQVWEVVDKVRRGRFGARDVECPSYCPNFRACRLKKRGRP